MHALSADNITMYDWYERIISTISDPISFVDRTYTYRAVNNTYARYAKRSKNEIVGLTVAEMIGQEAFEQRAKSYLDRCFAGEEIHYRAWFDVPQEPAKYMDVAYYPVVGPDGSIIGAAVNSRDITAQIQAQQDLERLYVQVRQQAAELELRVAERTATLQASEARFRALFEQVTTGIALIDDEGRLIETNPALQRILGYPAQTLQGKLFTEFITRSDKSQAADMYRLLMSGQRDEHRLEAWHTRPNGHPGWVNLIASPIRDQNGTPLFTICLIEDITERKQAQEALIHAERLSTAGRLAASLTHEISNPLQSVIGCLGLAQEALFEGGEVRQYLEVALEELRRVSRIVGQLRDLNRPTESAQFTPMDVHALIEQVLTLNRKACRERGIKTIYQAADALPLVALNADMMRQVFLNLTLNAIDAMPGGGALTITTVATDQPPGVCIAFQDTGVGIPPEVKTHLFEPFRSNKPNGLGIGLFVSREIVRRHGGQIDVQSQPGAGTTFEVRLPATAEDRITKESA
ncbi:MAG: PAS domain S-box protein [Anaerolineae bacterium]|nr:PAS domain S-box protein [Anaerolineae bacterium]